MWESNPPRVVLAPSTGFEVREGHQSPCAPAFRCNNCNSSHALSRAVLKRAVEILEQKKGAGKPAPEGTDIERTTA